MKKNLLKRSAICFLLICLCLTTLYIPNTVSETHPPIVCSYCSMNKTEFKEHVLQENTSPLNCGDKGHDVYYQDVYICKNTKCDHYNKICHTQNHHAELEPHKPKSAVHVVHNGSDSVKITCRCNYTKTMSHDAYIKNYGTRVKPLDPRYNQIDLTYHKVFIYDQYKCNIPGCSKTAEKFINKFDAEHRWQNKSQHLPARHQTALWKECRDCHKTKNRHYINDSSMQ